MRLDKFLKVSRLIKRRTVAKELADKGRISVNNKVAKSATDVKVGDELALKFGNKETKIRVLSIAETVKKDEAKDLYEILSETYQETL